jgi:heme O synthase-like polyprenyltransferase
VWQLPHVWLLQLASQDRESCVALPSLLQRLSERQVRRLLVVCVTAFGALSLLLPWSGLVTSPVAVILLVLHTLCLPVIFLWAACLGPSPALDRVLFHYWNGVVAGLLVLIVADNLWV